MPSLPELQRQVLRALLEGPDGWPGHLLAPVPVSAATAFGVHRDTVLGGLAEALALTYSTVLRLVGDSFFDQAAVAYVRADPPAQACLSAYGAGFAQFLESYPPAADLAYLADVARLDLALDRAGSAARLHRLIEIEPGVRPSLPVSLSVLTLQWPADQIRDALDAGAEEALASLPLERSPRAFAIWRIADGAGLKPLGPAAAGFLSALIANLGVAEALAQAAAEVGPAAALLAIQAEVFSASFAQIVTTEPRSPQPCPP